MKTKVGTPYYVAPEVLQQEYTKSCDIWLISRVITYILLCGYPPFYGDSDHEIFNSVRIGRFDFPSPEWDTISPLAKQFITKLLEKDPSKRLTASEAKQHAWLVKQLGPHYTNTMSGHSQPSQQQNQDTTMEEGGEGTTTTTTAPPVKVTNHEDSIQDEEDMEEEDEVYNMDTNNGTTTTTMTTTTTLVF
mmetsp:Transcript_13658/g.21331  ORF Transcript_13658/g.21331 Transcript_13658/m.21331 type:complete len:190 (+) Transcript_13658:991-1560(+)